MNLSEALAEAKVFVDGDWVESEDQDPNGDVRLIQLADVGDGTYVNKSSRFLTSEKAKELRCTFLEPGDVLVARMPDPIGRACLFPGDTKKAVTVVDVCVIRPDEKKTHARWLMHCLNAPQTRAQIANYATGTTRSRISRGNLKKVEVDVPPPAEQRRIAEVLDRAEALRTKRRAALAQLDTLTQSIFLDLFGDPRANSKGWPMSKVGDQADVQGGLQVTTARKGLPEEVPYLRVANVYRNRLDLREIKLIRATEAEVRRTTLSEGDLLIVEGHGNPEEIGRSCLWDGSIERCVHQNHIIRARFNPTQVTPTYACHYLNSEGGRRHLLKAGKTTTGLNTISVSEVKGAPLALPPLAIQGDFFRRIAAVEKIRSAQRASLAELDALFASLQHRAFRGEL